MLHFWLSHTIQTLHRNYHSSEDVKRITDTNILLISDRRTWRNAESKLTPLWESFVLDIQNNRLHNTGRQRKTGTIARHVQNKQAFCEHLSTSCFSNGCDLHPENRPIETVANPSIVPDAMKKCQKIACKQTADSPLPHFSAKNRREARESPCKNMRRTETCPIASWAHVMWHEIARRLYNNSACNLASSTMTLMWTYNKIKPACIQSTAQ